MHLKGSCHCGAVKFELDAAHPYPFNHCYCSICRKTQGGGGYAINLGGEADTMTVDGEENLSVYQATKPDGTKSKSERNFCGVCGSALWIWNSTWPELIHPFASAIDTELPEAPEHRHIMVGSKAGWVPLRTDPNDQTFDEYPDASVAEWHEKRNLTED